MRRVRLVGGLQPDFVLLLEEALEGDRVLFHLGDHDVAVAGGLLRPDDDEVTVRDVGVDHRVAADPEHVGVAARREHLRHGQRLADVLIRLDRTAGGDLADRPADVDASAASCDIARRVAAGAQRGVASGGAPASGWRRAPGSRRAPAPTGGGGRPTWRRDRRRSAISRTDGG